MNVGVVSFPGSNCDRDLAVAFDRAGYAVTRVWHKDTGLPAGTDVVGVPGGFSFGDDIASGKILANRLRYRLGSASDDTAWTIDRLAP